MRKTVKIRDVVDVANGMLLDLPDSDVAGRVAICSMLERILHDTGTYSGFQYLDANDMKQSANGTTRGVNEQNEDGTWDFDNTDRTRVNYF